MSADVDVDVNVEDTDIDDIDLDRNIPFPVLHSSNLAVEPSVLFDT